VQESITQLYFQIFIVRFDSEDISSYIMAPRLQVQTQHPVCAYSDDTVMCDLKMGAARHLATPWQCCSHQRVLDVRLFVS